LTGLSFQMKKMETISENISNVEKSPDKNGNVYQKKSVDFSKTGQSNNSKFASTLSMKLRKTHSAHLQPNTSTSQSLKNGAEFKVIEHKGDKLVFNPNHPQADEKGYVKMPDINMVEEMVDLISASRSYEANVTVIELMPQSKWLKKLLKFRKLNENKFY